MSEEERGGKTMKREVRWKAHRSLDGGERERVSSRDGGLCESRLMGQTKQYRISEQHGCMQSIRRH